MIRRARDVLATSEFASAYPGAFDAWAAAERLLWEGDSGSKLTTIGHNVREAMQAFATAMVDAYEPPGYARVLVRMRSGVEAWVYVNA